MENNELLNRVKNGDEKAIIIALKHKGAIYRINALINIVRHSIVDSSKIIELVYQLLEDGIILDGYKVSDFAYATLDLIGIESYCGDNSKVKALIDSRFEF